jgi:signal transduction histidine kinase
MTEMTETPHSLTLSRYPGPACSYELQDDSPILRAPNERFRSLFRSPAEGDSLRTIFEEGGLEPIDDWERLDRRFGRETEFHARLLTPDGDPVTYLVQVIPPEDDESGHVLFTDVDADHRHNGFGVDRVASVISHDLRNPLDVAKARLRAAKEMDEPAHLDNVEQAHDRMERIIQDVLTLARGEEVIEPKGSVDLSAVARDAWDTVETNGASLTVSDTLPSTVADRDRIKRLFENLFRNAVEHGGDDVEITVMRLDDGDGFYVADDGTGIPSEHHEDIFEPGHSSTDHGTGLGLAIVRRIADVHGWSVSVTDSTGGGARFEFEGVETSE